MELKPSWLAFEHNGKHYAMLFDYEKKKLHLPDTVMSVKKRKGRPAFKVMRQVPSAKPYTTVRIHEVLANGALAFPCVRSATVGCWHGDEYNKNQGRVRALRVLTKGLRGARTKDKPLGTLGEWEPFVVKMWASYNNRAKQHAKTPPTAKDQEAGTEQQVVPQPQVAEGTEVQA